MNNGARRPPAVTGSITIESSGMPTMENPPPNAPFMKQIRNTPANAIRIVVTVSSMGSSPCSEAMRRHGRRAADAATARRTFVALGAIGAIRLVQLEGSDYCIGSIGTLHSVQLCGKSE